MEEVRIVVAARSKEAVEQAVKVIKEQFTPTERYSLSPDKELMYFSQVVVVETKDSGDWTQFLSP